MSDGQLSTSRPTPGIRHQPETTEKTGHGDGAWDGLARTNGAEEKTDNGGAPWMLLFSKEEEPGLVSERRLGGAWVPEVGFGAQRADDWSR